MNHLNSLIIEGNIKNVIGAENEAVLLLETLRNYKTPDGETSTETSYFETHLYGNLAAYVQKQKIEGRGCRFVGRLKSVFIPHNENGASVPKQIIVCDHIELKPFFKK